MLRSGDRIGPYTLINKLGKGGFGVVWLAERRTRITTTKAAIKISLDEDIDLEKIKQEADVWVHASGHPNVLPIIEADIYDDQVIIASEYAPDGSLEKFLKGEGTALTIESKVEIISGILAGLEHLHSRNIIHRDLKPANILFQGNTPRLADFGVSRILKSTNQSNIAAGTPSYMAPEAFDGKRSKQTDIWSVGVIFYQLLTGRLPFAQEDIASLVGAILTRHPEPLPPEIPPGFQNIIARALAKDASQRYPSAAEMRSDLLSSQNTVTAPNYQFDKSIFTVQTLQNTIPSSPVQATTEKRGNRPHLIYAMAGLLAVIIVVLGIISLFNSTKEDPSPTNTNASPVANVLTINSPNTQTSPKSNSAPQPPPNLGKIDELNGSSMGIPGNITFEAAIDGKGAVFSRENESRIQYPNLIPSEGTLEWWINVRNGYSYSDYKLNPNQSIAMIFTTAAADVTYPGSTWVKGFSDGTLIFDMATTKGEGPKQTLIAEGTNFRFNQWHALGISFGSQGQYIMLDGQIVASAPKNTQKLGRGGTQEAAVDIPTVGELVSGLWENNRYDSGFEGIVDRFRISNQQKDFYLSAQSPK